MPTGTIFEIREFSLFDGDGIRTTVFLKGCRLRCAWCHNPEGLDFRPQVLFNASRCRHCETCLGEKCPFGVRRLCGYEIDDETLAKKLLRQADVFRSMGGGVTFSGGEPLAQSGFVRAVSERLKQEGISIAVETSGYVSRQEYQTGLELADLVFQDLKHPFAEEHQKFTGGNLALILRNLAYLRESGKRFILRIPLIPNVNDSPECMRAFAELAAGCERVEVLPYHLTAGAKYPLIGKEYHPPFLEQRKHPIDLSAFESRGIPCKVL
ncbi:MAG: radical SAM protein [Planctomycetia bacterium]|nr:radical SAM protein [Planctomycetia bacterium]